jgi:small subunit ribosomal protein S1
LSEIKNTSIIQLEEVDEDQLNELIDATFTEFDEGSLVSGTVVKIEHDEVLLDIGFKSEGVIPARELSIRKDVDPSEIVEIGSSIEALVLIKEDKDGRLILSKKRAEYERAWIDVENKFNASENVTGEVIEVVKGGLIIDIGLRGFLPASLVDLRRVRDLDSYLGTSLEARIIEMDRHRNNVVLSRRVVLEEGRKFERNEILEKLTPGMRLKGEVSSIVDFGAFVDLGGIDGLVHISELSWSHVTHPSEVVKVGDEVDVEVLEIDLGRERISLGLKQTTEDPWYQLVKNFPVGAIIEGKVTKLVSFGAFVELGDNIEGLVHISEMSPRHIESPAQVVHVGDTVHVKVQEIDEGRRRISLSMKSAAETLGIEIEVSEPDPNMPKPKAKSKVRRDSEDAEGETSASADTAEDGDKPAEAEAPVEEVATAAEEAPAEEVETEEAEATAVEEVEAPAAEAEVPATEAEAPAEPAEPAETEEAAEAETSEAAEASSGEQA